MHPDDLIHQCPKLTPQQLRQTRRRRLLSQNGGACFFCLTPNAQTLDHLIAKANGGGEHDSNLVACCARDNASKGAEAALSWYSRQRFYTEAGEHRLRDRLARAREWVV